MFDPQMPPMARFELRIPEELKAAVQAEAEEQGMDAAEYVRQALYARLAWSAAVRAARQGASLDDLDSPERLIAALRRLVEATAEAQDKYDGEKG